MKVSYQCLVANSPTLLYQGNNLQALVVTNFLVSNSDAGNVNISIYLVPPGGSPGISNAFLITYKLAGNSFIQGSGGFVVQPTYAVYVEASTNHLVTASISGDLIAQAS